MKIKILERILGICLLVVLVLRLLIGLHLRGMDVTTVEEAEVAVFWLGIKNDIRFAGLILLTAYNLVRFQRKQAQQDQKHVTEGDQASTVQEN